MLQQTAFNGSCRYGELKAFCLIKFSSCSYFPDFFYIFIVYYQETSGCPFYRASVFVLKYLIHQHWVYAVQFFVSRLHIIFHKHLVTKESFIRLSRPHLFTPYLELLRKKYISDIIIINVSIIIIIFIIIIIINGFDIIIMM